MINDWQKQWAFLIPFRTDNGPRQVICDWVVKRINFFFPEAKVYFGNSPSGEFNRSAAINDAFSQIEGQKYIAINDSDTVWNPYTIINGFHSLVYDSKFVIPYSNYVALTKESTDDILSLKPSVGIDNLELHWEFNVNVNPHVYHAPPVSGLCVMKSDDFAKVKFDERFVGWGEEDVAFVIRASSILGKPYRCGGPVYHLWHPRSAEYDQPHYAKNRRLLNKEYL